MRNMICGLILVLVAMPAGGDILNVPGDFPTIQAAIDAAQDGDEIVLAPGRYVITTTLIEPAVPLRLVIRSSDPGDPAVRDATVLVRPSDQPVFLLALTPSLVIRGLTLESTSENASFLNANYVGDGLGGGRFEVEFDRCASTGVRAVQSASLDVDLIGDTSHDINLRVLGCDFDQAWSGLRAAQGTALIRDTTMTESRRGVIAFRGIDAAGSTFDRVRNFVFAGGGSGGVSSITDCEFIDCSAVADLGGEVTFARVSVTGGSGIETSGNEQVVIEDSTFDGLSGVAVQGNRLAVRRCSFTGGDFDFGAVHVFGGDSLIEDCDFVNNRGRFASAVELHLPPDVPPTIIRRSRFIGNGLSDFPPSNAATIQVLGSGRSEPRSGLTIEDCLFQDNATLRGGAFSMPFRFLSGPIVVRRSVFLRNTAEDGAIYSNLVEFGPLRDRFNDIDRVVDFEKCLFIGNSADTNAIASGAATFIDCTFADNTANDGSLGVGEFVFQNTSFLPKDSSVPVLGTPSSGDFVPSITALFSIVPQGIQGTNTTTLDPLFVRNPSDGGDGWGDDPSTPDIDEALNDDFGDLRLRPGSPAIDAGTNDFFMPGDPSADRDLDGNPRLADDPGIPGFAVDIGAYEFQGTTCLPDVNQDGMVSPADYNAWILAYNNGSPLADQNRDGRVSPADFNAWILNFNNGC